MKILAISSKDITSLLSMEDCIEAMEQTLANLAGGQIVLPLRQVYRITGNPGVLAVMPAVDSGAGILGAKILSVFHENYKVGRDSHQGMVVLFESGHGMPLAVLNASEITGIRTAAVSAVATRHLARKSATELMVMGCGLQALKHLEALRLVRPITRVYAWDPFPGAAESFAKKAFQDFGIKVVTDSGERPGKTGADIICTLTPSREPVLFGADVGHGTHINAVGACSPSARELDSELVRKSRVFVDQKEAALHEAGDILIPISEGRVAGDHIVGEIGQVCSGEIKGRISDGDITLFESVGIAIEDLAAANLVYEKALRAGVGARIEL